MTIPMEDLDDEYVVGRLKSDAANSAKKYEMVGLEAYMPTSRPTMGAPKPNTRFLRNILRETDNHNAALLAKEAEESRARLKALRHQEEGRLSPYTSDLHRTRDRKDIEHPSKRRRDEESDERHSRKKRRSGDSSSHRNRGDRSRDRDRKNGSAKDRERKRDSSRHRYRRREKYDKAVSDHEDNGESSKHIHHRHRSRDQRRRHRSSSDSAERSARYKRESHRDRKRRASYSRSPSRSRSPRKSHTHRKPTETLYKSRSKRQDSSSLERTRSISPNSKRASRKSPINNAARRPRSPSIASDSDPLEAIVGPAPPPPQPKVRLRGRGAFRATSAMDSHFSISYDPTVDVQVNSDVEDDWDEALEAMRDRQKWKQQGAERLRAAGFTDEMVKKWEKGGEKNEDDVVWAKKGEGREWDRGKVVDDEGAVDVKAEWGRLKGT